MCEYPPYKYVCVDGEYIKNPCFNGCKCPQQTKAKMLPPSPKHLQRALSYKPRKYFKRRGPKPNGRKKFFRTQEWKDIRAQVLERDGRKCLWCDSQENLTVHHVRDGNDHSLNNLATVCWKCHSAFHRLYPQNKLLKAYYDAEQLAE